MGVLGRVRALPGRHEPFVARFVYQGHPSSGGAHRMEGMIIDEHREIGYGGEELSFAHSITRHAF
eukprot:15437010-Alexandrium_andersonii.AAC.1